MKKRSVTKGRLSGHGRSSRRCLSSLFVLICCYFCLGSVYGQQVKKDKTKVALEDVSRSSEQQIIGQLLGVVSDLKQESDKPSAALLLSEIADVLWRFDEP